MSDIVERAAYYEAWARDIRALNGTSVDADYSDETARVLRECAAEIERLRAGERAADAEIERLRAALTELDGWYEARGREIVKRGERAEAAEAQRDALVRAAAPIIAETAREDRDDYRVRVKTVDIRALSAAVADARGAGGEG